LLNVFRGIKITAAQVKSHINTLHILNISLNKVNHISRNENNKIQQIIILKSID